MKLALKSLCATWLVACGGQPGNSPDAGAMSDGTPSPTTTSTLSPRWIKTFAEAGVDAPRVGMTPSGDVVGAFERGYLTDSVTIGELHITDTWKPVVAWLSGDAGTVLRARQITSNVSSDRRAAVGSVESVAVDRSGGVYIAGEYGGADPSVFHAGTPVALTLQAATNNSEYARDPYLVRYDRETNPVWTRHGRTPSPLTDTWWNYADDISAFPDGGVFFVGEYQDDGFAAFGTTLAGPGGTYFAKVDSTGTPVWIVRNLGKVEHGVARTASDGSVYVVMYVDRPVKLLADSAQPVDLAPLDEGHTRALIKLTADGAIAWIRQMVFDSRDTATLEVEDDGSVVLGVDAGATAAFLDGAGNVADSLAASGDDVSVLARWTSDGTLAWATALPEGVSVKSPIVPLRRLDDGDLWGVAYAIDEGARLTLLYRVSPTGEASIAHVIGSDLAVTDLASDGTDLAVAAFYDTRADGTTTGGNGRPQVFDAGGQLVALPAGVVGSDENIVFAKYQLHSHSGDQDAPE